MSAYLKGILVWSVGPLKLSVRIPFYGYHLLWRSIIGPKGKYGGPTNPEISRGASLNPRRVKPNQSGIFQTKFFDILTLRRATSETSTVGIGGGANAPPPGISGLGRHLGFPFGPVIDLHDRSWLTSIPTWSHWQVASRWPLRFSFV